MIAMASDEGGLHDHGPSALGSMWRNTIACCLTPSERAARTWSLVRWASIEPRSRRAKIGTWTTAIATISVHWLGVRASEAMVKARSSDGDRQHHVDDAHDERVDPAADRARERAEHEPADEAEERGTDTHHQGLATADDQTRQQVATAVVAAERVTRLRSWHRVGLGPHLVEKRTGGGVPRRDPRGDDRQHDEGDGDRQAEEEDRVATQAVPRTADERDPRLIVDRPGRARGRRCGRAAPAVRRATGRLGAGPGVVVSGVGRTSSRSCSSPRPDPRVDDGVGDVDQRG